MAKNTEVSFSDQYYKVASGLDEIYLLVVGQDPYPTGANGVAFCKNKFPDFFDEYCCGKDVLYSLGISEEFARSEYLSPKECFMRLLTSQKICFINARNELTENPSDQELEAQLQLAKIFNMPFIMKAKNIVLLGKVKTKMYFDSYQSGYSYGEVLIHPTSRNKNKTSLPEWTKVWGNKYLQKKYDLKIGKDLT